MSVPEGAEEWLALLAARRSVRRFRPDAPPDELLRRLIEAAVTAPSASNKQPWRFVIVRERERIAALAAAVKAEVERLSEWVEPESRAIVAGYGSYFWRFEAAPVLIAPLWRRSPLLSHLLEAGGQAEPELRARVDLLEQRSGLIGTSLAIQNLLLAAHALGLGASGMTGPLVAEPALRELLALPRAWELACLIPVGWPDEDPPAPARKPVESVIRWLP